MFELVREGGWVMLPIIIGSVAAMAIIVERIWSLRRQRICPRHLVSQIWEWAKDDHVDVTRISALRAGSPLGEVLAAGLMNREHSREVMKESIEEAGRHVVLELERYLNTLGSIAAVSPLLGLYGTVLGMIKIFSDITSSGVGNPAVLAGGISEALITTVAGLTVAIPSLIAHRYFQRKVDELVSTMEQEALKMVEILHGEREQNGAEEQQRESA
ncbi:MAG: MotA/TolQ/ExbB proton channel family protein [Gammaproteobacteria bacterium]